MIRCLSIQIRAGELESDKVNEVVRLSRSLGRYPEIDRGEDLGFAVNLNYFSENVHKLWNDLREGLLCNGAPEKAAIGDWLKGKSIVVCEGENDGGDYLLLHHFDSSEPLDHL